MAARANESRIAGLCGRIGKANTDSRMARMRQLPGKGIQANGKGKMEKGIMSDCKHLWIAFITAETYDAGGTFEDWYECLKCGIKTETPILETLQDALDALLAIW